MTVSAASVQAKAARLALVQLAQPGAGDDKAANLAHARDKIAEAVRGGREGKKPDLVVLPVRPAAARSSVSLSRALSDSTPTRGC